MVTSGTPLSLVAATLIVLLVDIMIHMPHALTSRPVTSFTSTCACIILNKLQYNSSFSLLATARLAILLPSLSEGDRLVCEESQTNSRLGFASSQIQLVDQNGDITSDFELAVGARAPTVFEYCGRQVIRERFDFPMFSTTVIELFIPWFALASQLPFQTGKRRHNLFSALISIGNPLWTGLSMGVMTFYGIYVRRSLKRLHLPEGAPDADDVGRVIRAWLQGPVHIRSSTTELMLLIESPLWWKTAAKSLGATEMTTDSRFAFPFTLAIVVWLWTLIAACFLEQIPGSAASGDSLEWQISIGSLWLWMVPYTYGWTAIRAQSTSGTLSKALKAADKAAKIDKSVIIQGSWDTDLRDDSSPLQSADDQGRRSQFTLPGGEELEGPLSAPWRLLRSLKLLQIVLRELQYRYMEIPHMEMRSKTVHNSPSATEDGTHFSTESIYAFNIHHNQRNLPNAALPYPEWNEIDWTTFLGVGCAYVGALATYFGTTGVAMIVLYLTPPRGLGCLSGGLFIHLTVSVVSSALKLISILFAHKANLDVQRQFFAHSREAEAPMRPVTSVATKLCSVTSITTRLFANMLDVLNGLWVITWCLIVFTNVRQQPYCSTVYPALLNHGWTQFWGFSAHQFKFVKEQEIHWLGGALAVTYATCITFWFLSCFSGVDSKLSWKKSWLLLAGTTALLAALIVPFFLMAIKAASG